MQKLTKTIQDYVDSLEKNMLSEDQQAQLLVGESEQVYGGANRGCSNRSSSCDGSINKGICTNLNASGCVGAANRSDCTSTEYSLKTPEMED